MLTNAELILGLHRHLSAFAASPATAALGQLSFAGQVFEIAWRLRGSGVSTGHRVAAIGVDAAIGQRTLLRDVLPALAALGWVELDVREGTLYSVSEAIPPPAELVNLADAVLAVALPTPVEKAALALVLATTRQPLLTDAAIEAGMAGGGASEEDAVAALRHLAALSLVRRLTTDDGREIVFNPNVWVGDTEVMTAALRVEDARVRTEIGALIEEISANPGMPQDHVTSTERKWVDFAVALGLVQRSLVVTSDHKERAFLFTPHIARDPFGIRSGDPSGHVRQLIGSMIYATTFAEYRLDYPAAFVRRLLQDGEAGDASPISTDYPMLEKAGIVRVEPAMRYSKLVLLQADVAEGALQYLEDRAGGTGSATARGLGAQRSYIHVERERARLAHTAPVDSVEARRLMSALRDTTARRDFRVR